MTKFSKAFMAFVVFCFSQLTFAGPPTISCGSYRVAQGESCNAFRIAYDQNGNPQNGIAPMQYVNQNDGNFNGGGYWQQNLAQQVIQVPYNQQPPNGYCSFDDRAKNMFAGAFFGAIVGAIAKDSREGARQGAALGATMGLFVPCASLQQAGGSNGWRGQGGNPCADQGRVPVNVNGELRCKLPERARAQRVAQLPPQPVEDPCADQPGRVAVYLADTGEIGCKRTDRPLNGDRLMFP